MASSKSGYLPRTDHALLQWAVQFHSVLVLDPLIYGVTAGDCTTLNGHIGNFQTKLAQVDPVIRSKTSVAAKNTSRSTLKSFIQQLAKTVYGKAGLSNEQITELGLTVRKEPAPWPVPVIAPVVSIANVVGNTLTVKLRDVDLTRRGKPVFTKGAAIYFYVGEDVPNENTPWIAFGNTGRTNLNMEFPSTLPQGTKVWIIAAWFNNRGQFGPSCQPISTLLLGQSTFQQGNLKLAA